MSVEKKELLADVIAEARTRYAVLYGEAMPHSGGIGHAGKVLINLPGQLLLEHGHVDTFVLKADAAVPASFIDLTELVNDFQGIYTYESDGSIKMENDAPVFTYRAGDVRVVQADQGSRPFPVHARQDKSETFKAIYGDGVLLTGKASVLHAPAGVDTDRVPADLEKAMEQVRCEQEITTARAIYMAPCVNVLLPKCTCHALLAGEKGAVYPEFSTPAMDEADRFGDPRVIR